MKFECKTCEDQKEYYIEIPALGIMELVNCEDCNPSQSKDSKC